MTEIAIHTEGLTKRFGDFIAVEDLSLEVDDGTVVSLLGPNGAGKTTTVRMLATLLRPDAGHARVGGYDVVTDAARVRELISLTGQFAALDKNLTARENLVLMARLRGRNARAGRALADQLIDRFDIGDFRDRLVKNLSGGERRRVDLAAGLIDTPHVLVLDEPTTGLDPRSRQVVWTTIRELVGDGVTLLLTTQYLEEADALADRVVLIDRGTEVAAGTPAQLKAQVGEQRVDIIAADSAAFTELCDLLWERFEVTPAAEQRMISIPAPREAADLAHIAAVVDESGISVDEVALRRPTLDDAFLALTGHAAHEPDPRGRGGRGMTTATATAVPGPHGAAPHRAAGLRPRHDPAHRAQPAGDPARARAPARRDDPADRLHPAVPLRVRLRHPRAGRQLQGLHVPGDHRPVAGLRDHRRRASPPPTT